MLFARSSHPIDRADGDRRGRPVGRDNIPSPVSGVIIYIGAIPSMKKGDNVAVIGEPAENP